MNIVLRITQLSARMRLLNKFQLRHHCSHACTIKLNTKKKIQQKSTLALFKFTSYIYNDSGAIICYYLIRKTHNYSVSVVLNFRCSKEGTFHFTMYSSCLLHFVFSVRLLLHENTKPKYSN